VEKFKEKGGIVGGDEPPSQISLQPYLAEDVNVGLAEALS